MIVPSSLNALFYDNYIPLNSLIPFAILLIVCGFLWFLRWPARNIKARDIHPIRASSFRPDLVPPPNIDTIVIGSGSGGCACANLLAQSGQKVLLLEQHNRTGGCTHTFRIDVSFFVLIVESLFYLLLCTLSTKTSFPPILSHPHSSLLLYLF